jgi:hypothetical protein
MEINGLPLHPLVVHAAVVFLPLAALLALVYAAVPRWRWATRWPMVGMTAVALGSIMTAYFSGKNFLSHRPELEQLSAVKLHQERAAVLFWVTIVFTVLVGLAAWGLGGPTGLASGRFARGRHNPLVEWSLVALLVIMSIASLAMVIQTGDAGATAVWGASSPTSGN